MGPLAPSSADTSGRLGTASQSRSVSPTAANQLRLPGVPIRLFEYSAQTITNRQFQRFDLERWDRFYLPASIASLVDATPGDSVEFIEDDNRSAIVPEPVVTLDHQEFYLSVKGVGSTVDPFSFRRLDRGYAAELAGDPEVRSRLSVPLAESTGGVITGELWLRGSPYGGQGLAHAMTALKVSEQANVTSIGGFRIAPVVKIALLPADLEERLRSIHWYRRFPGRMVQEIRLVPSNVRIYFHAHHTVGNDIARVFDLFGIDTPANGHRFEINFVRSGVAFLTLFARTLTPDARPGRYSGLDFQDVWLDKDAVIARDGTAFFVDLEGIDSVSVEASEVREKVEDQIYRSLYEFMFAYEQIRSEIGRRFGADGSRKRHFESILESALHDDPFVRLRAEDRRVTIEIRNRCNDASLNSTFPLVDH